MTSLAPILVGITGGLAIFIYGMQLGGEGLQKAAGDTLRNLLHRLTSHRLMGVMAGAVVTVLIQSSSATTVMLVGFAGAQLISLQQSIGVILGADIGTTLTVQLIAFKVTDYALLMIALGLVIRLAGRRQRHRYIGQVILGFGFIFFGMGLMSRSVEPLRSYPAFTNALLTFGKSPLLGVLVAAGFTAIIQGSAATIGLVLSLSMQGLISLPAAIPLIFGANIGTCATALLSAIGAPTKGLRVAVAHTLFKVLGVAIFLPFLRYFISLVEATTPSLPRQIANAHSIFNIGITVMFLPFAPYLGRLVERMVPERGRLEALSKPMHLDRHALATPALAVNAAAKEVERVAALTAEMVRDSVGVLLGHDEGAIRLVATKEDAVDRLFKEIVSYLANISQQTLSDEDSQRIMSLLFIVNDLEHIGDVVANITHFSQKRMDRGVMFSRQGEAEIREIHEKVNTVVERVVSALGIEDRETASELAAWSLAELPGILSMERRSRQSHMQRLQAGLDHSHATSSIHLDVINGYVRIADYATNIAQTLLGRMTLAAHKEFESADYGNEEREPQGVAGSP